MGAIEAHAGVAGRQCDALLEQELDMALATANLDDAKTPGIADFADLHRDTLLVEQDKLGPHADLGSMAIEARGRAILDLDRLASEQHRAVTDFAGQDVHAG
jgi:hypothetical protein